MQVYGTLCVRKRHRFRRLLGLVRGLLIVYTADWSTCARTIVRVEFRVLLSSSSDMARRQQQGAYPTPDNEHHGVFMIHSRLYGYEYDRSTHLCTANEEGLTCVYVRRASVRSTWCENVMLHRNLNLTLIPSGLSTQRKPVV